MNVFLIFVAVLALFIADVLTPIFILRFKNAKFSKQSLQNDEKILSIAKTHWFVLLKTVLAQLLISVVFIPILVSLFKENIIGDGIVVFSIIGLIFLFYLRKQVLYCLREFVITDKRILFKFGILSRTTSEFRFEKVESCDVEQGVLGRIFGFGSIIVRGVGGTCNVEQYVSDPFEVRQYIIDILGNKEVLSDSNSNQLSVNQNDSVEKLRAYKKLMEEGVISEEDFEKKKQQILSEN